MTADRPTPPHVPPVTGSDAALRGGAPGLHVRLPDGRAVPVDPAAHPCARHLVAEVLAEHRTGGRTLPPPPALSERERQILDLIAAGHSNDEIARALYLSINSVKTYIRQAYRKIGVNRRAQAVLWVLGRPIASDATDSTPGPGAAHQQ